MTPTLTVRGRRFRAVVFDLDGVLTDTANLHRRAWKQVFDAFLTRHDPTQPEFNDADYLTWVDGRQRADGVRSFLASRSITLPETADDTDSVTSLATRKNDLFRDLLHTDGVHTFPAATDLLHRLHDAAVPVAVVTASRNATTVLAAAGLTDCVDALVDGNEAARLTLPGKPDPALFLEALRRLHVAPADTVAVEDAEAGVAAAHRGGFGLVVGVGDATRHDALRRAGADVAVTDLTDLDVRL